MAAPLYSLGQGVKAALVVAAIAGLVVALVAYDVPVWVPIALSVATVVFLVVLVGALVHRDPEQRLRSSLVRGLMFLATLIVLKTLAGWTVDIAGVGTTARIAFGQPWYIDLASLAFALVCVIVALQAYTAPLRVPAPMPVEPIDEPDPLVAGAGMPEVFIERVKLLLTHRSFARHELELAGDPGYLIGTRHDTTGRHPVVVRCDDRAQPVTDADVGTAVEFARRTSAELYYVTLTEVSRTSGPGVQFFHEAQLMDQLIHFDDYLRRLIEVYRTAPLPYSLVSPPRTLEKTFVPPRFTVQGAAQPAAVPLNRYLDDWLAESGPRQIALLADYGMGKSSFLKHYAAYLANERLEGRSKRIPILISLTGQSPRTAPRAPGLISGFIERYKLRCEYGAFDVLMRSGQLVFLLDAFDEMDLVGDRAMRLDHFVALWELYVPGNKLLLAGRPTFFPDDAELEQALRIGRGTARHGGRMYCDRVNLAPFEPADIQASFASYFPKREADDYFQFVVDRPRLVDLARRPAMTHIIRETMHTLQRDPALKDSAVLREAILIDIYTRHWIERQLDVKRKLLVSEATRRAFVERLAEWMFDSEAKAQTVSSAKLVELYERWFPDEAKQIAGANGASRPHLIEGIETDLRNCTFMVPSESGFSFAHKPFYEFFVAKRIDRLLAEGQTLPLGMRNRRLGPEICLHVGDLWFARAGDKVEDQAQAIADRVIGEGLPFRQEPRHNALQVLLRAGVRYTWIERHLFNRVLRALGVTTYGPAVLAELELGGARFDGASLAHVSLVGKNLDGARFSKAKLNDVDLTGASLRTAGFDGAHLDRVVFDDAKLAGAAFVGASIARSFGVRADARGVHFMGARVFHLDLRHAVLDGADLDEATLHEVDLRAASLLGADLDVGSINGTRLTGARIGAALWSVRFPTHEAIDTLPPARELDAPLLGTCTALRWHPDGQLFGAISRGMVWLFDAGRGALIGRLAVPGQHITALELDRDALTVATAEGVLQRSALDGVSELAIRIGGGLVALGRHGRSACVWSGDELVAYRFGTEWHEVAHRIALVTPPRAIAIDPGGAHVAYADDHGYAVCELDAKRTITFTTLRGAIELQLIDHYLLARTEKRCALHFLDEPASMRHPPWEQDVQLARLDHVDLYSIDTDAPDRIRRRLLHKAPAIVAEHERPSQLHALAGSYHGSIAFATPTGIELSTEPRAKPRPPVRWLDPQALATELLRRMELLSERPLRREARPRLLVPAVTDTDSLVGALFFDERIATVSLGTLRFWSVDALAPTEEQPPLTGFDFRLVEIRDGGWIEAGRSTIAASGAWAATVDRSTASITVADPQRTSRVLRGPHDPLASPAFEVDRLVFSAGEDVLIAVEDARLTAWEITGRELGELWLPAAPAALACHDRTVWIATDTIESWTIGRSDTEARWTPHSPVTALAVSDDGGVLAAGLRDGSIVVWDADDDELPTPIGRHLTHATGVDFSPDGKYLVSTGRDDVVRIWDIAQNAQHAVLHHLPAGWASVAADGTLRRGGDVGMLRVRHGLASFALDELPA